ncbi:HNH endonuclease domain protein [Enterococcus phage ZXL]|uniref:NUMOD4 domain-containing protein n=2 Tax=Efquatrovirus LY0322 TaxID=2560427 RepID=A0A7S6IL79_9CAUD|nr:HNH endonuclease [Enterococcus phage LY0322]AWD92311.1 hypothetical protein [Enterococcus phage LY0322]QOI67903.1 hypothetical protein [Enterococcus phage FX417]UVA48317.1 HNH endonuclease domain protein [Enterococcus phage ZXL]WCS66452.1 HNH homing endonuclease [Enterococcus phage DEfc27b]
MIEEWKDIKGYEGLYQVSNLGRVKSKYRKSERILKPVKAIDIANGEWNEYRSIRECARQLSLNHGNISNCLQGRCKQVGGYVFKYAN